MKYFLVSKYNKSSEKDKKEWTHLEQLVDRNASNPVLPTDYLRVEQNYLHYCCNLFEQVVAETGQVRAEKVLLNFNMEEFNSESRTKLALYSSIFGNIALDAVGRINDASCIDVLDAIFIVQLGLRNLAFAEIGASGFRLTVLHDLYLAIGSDLTFDMERARRFDLFAQPSNDIYE
jgi:hypothetical protein